VPALIFTSTWPDCPADRFCRELMLLMSRDLSPRMMAVNNVDVRPGGLTARDAQQTDRMQS